MLFEDGLCYDGLALVVLDRWIAHTVFFRDVDRATRGSFLRERNSL